MGRGNRKPLTTTTDLQTAGDTSSCENGHNGLHYDLEMTTIVCANKAPHTSSPAAVPAGIVNVQSTEEDPDQETPEPDCSGQVPGNPREKEFSKKSKKKGTKRKKKETTTVEEPNVCTATISDCLNTVPNTSNKNDPKMIGRADTKSPERTEKMMEDTPPPEGVGGNTMATGKKGKKRRKKSVRGPGSHENSRCEEDLAQQTEDLTPSHEDHDTCNGTCASQRPRSNSTGTLTNDMQLHKTTEENRIKAKLEANAAGLEELHILKQSQMAKVHEALAMVKQRCRHHELTSSHLSPPISPSRLGLKNFFSWSFDLSNGSSSSLYNEPIIEADEEQIRPRAATFSCSKDGKAKQNMDNTNPGIGVTSPIASSTPLKKQFTQPRGLNGTQLTYIFPSPMHAVLLQYESLSSIDGKQEETEQEGQQLQESNQNNIVQRRDIHGADHKTIPKTEGNRNKKVPKKQMDSGLLDMRGILKELSHQEENKSSGDISNVDYPFNRLSRSASLGAYDKKREKPSKLTRSNSLKKCRSQGKPTKRHLNQDKENNAVVQITKPVGLPKTEAPTRIIRDVNHGHNKPDPFLQSRVRSFSMSEERSPAAKRIVLLRESSVSCSDIDKSQDPNSSTMPHKPTSNYSSDDEDEERMVLTKGPVDKQPLNLISVERTTRVSTLPVSSLTNLSVIQSEVSPRNKTITRVKSMMTKLRSHGSLEHLFQRRWRTSLSKLDLNIADAAPEWEFPMRHRSVSDLNPGRRYNTIVSPDMTVVSMPERSLSVNNNAIAYDHHSNSTFKQNSINRHSVASATPSQTLSQLKVENVSRHNYLKLKRKSCPQGIC